jgi:RNA-directed DNA polymerase
VAVTTVLSVRDFAWRARTPLLRLRAIAADIASHYRVETLKKGSKVRILHVPKDELKAIQRRILRHILIPCGLSDDVHGGVRGRSPASNAERHVAQPFVVNLDVRDFYPSVKHERVYMAFRKELGFGADVAALLTKLTTLKDQLPQGAPTSGAVANLVLSAPVDGPLGREAASRGVAYTRFVDDITLSGRDPKLMIGEVGKALARRGLTMHRKKAKWHTKPKLSITPRSKAQRVTGLNVNSVRGPSVPREKRDAVRNQIHRLKFATPTQRVRMVASIRGSIAYTRQFNPGSATRLERYLSQTLASPG